MHTIELRVEADVPGIDDATFQEYAARAKAGCPVSKALAGVSNVALTAVLQS
ncbi:MAG: OsmC family protein [Anaerolineaceae bacterium]|nr:OsmC family protein [Anaerolineaceae bacterium]